MSRRSRGSLQAGGVVDAGGQGAGIDDSERIEPTASERLRSAGLLAVVVTVTGLVLAGLVTITLLGALYVAVRALDG